MIQIQLDEKIAAALTDEARLRGLSLEQFLAELAARRPAFPPLPMSGDEVARLIESEATASDSSYADSYSREDIYVDHD